MEILNIKAIGMQEKLEEIKINSPSHCIVAIVFNRSSCSVLVQE